MMDANNQFCVTQVSCIRQQRRLFANISFQLQSGEALLIEGPNGSGKSSLLKILTGLSTPAEGDVIWQGESIQQCREEYAQHLHYIGHTNGIKLGLTVTENLQLACHLSPSLSYSSITHVLSQFQLIDFKNKIARNLSAGQKRRVALAKLFLIPKKIWILDEPLTALDAETQTFFLTALENHLQQGGIAIISSHHTMTLHNANIKNLRLASC